MEEIATSRISKNKRTTIPKSVVEVANLKVDGKESLKWYIDEDEEGKFLRVEPVKVVERKKEISAE